MNTPTQRIQHRREALRRLHVQARWSKRLSLLLLLLSAALWGVLLWVEEHNAFIP